MMKNFGIAECQGKKSLFLWMIKKGFTTKNNNI